MQGTSSTQRKEERKGCWCVAGRSAAFLCYLELLVNEVRMEEKRETLVGTYICTLDQELKGLELILHRELGSCWRGGEAQFLHFLSLPHVRSEHRRKLV